ncbi:hypothetical protein [Streptomyces sp. NPDC007991]|uniref:hypothetical protein n=1 Tax=Streptomyces sp. NPDC007991 TaxID=3364803 RepID=UPI0036E2D00C
MATALMSPFVARDEVSLGDAVELFRETGHPISKSTLERQCRARGVVLVKRGRANWASWSDLLRVHAAWVDTSGKG